MEAVLERLQTLTPDQLRQEITGAGLTCGPITSSTRSLFEKKLARVLLESQTEACAVTQKSSDEISDRSSDEISEESSGHVTEVPQTQAGNDINHEAESTDSPQTPSVNPSVYYGVCPQPDDPSGEDGMLHVYVDKTKALKVLMKMKGARFKAFSTKEEAESFAKGLCEGGLSPHKLSPEQPIAGSVKEWLVSLETVNVEKANDFKSPRTQDLTAKLRKAVENGDKETFKELVWGNPRYLIGSGDNPTIVQEGCRYNVLHVAAKENQPEISRLILETLENPEFMRLMYPHDQQDMLQQRIRYIVDLYLNTPDKASNETPLHFACKFGCAEVVNVLCSHPFIDKNRRNKYSQTPSSVICERKNKTREVKQKIMEYLEDRFYVPLLRAADNTLHPVIGNPWSPGSSDQFLGPVMVESPKNPIMTVKAFVGPLNASKAEEFHRLWKTPPRDRAKYFHHILKSDCDQGAERVGRELAREMGYPWAEYWEFLNCFIDLSTEDGLEMLEEYLSSCFESITENSKITARSVGSPERTPSTGGRTHLKDHLNSSFDATRELFRAENLSKEDEPEGDSRLPVCDLMQEFEKVSFQRSLLSSDGSSDSGLDHSLSSPNENEHLDLSWDEQRSKQAEDDKSSCDSEDYFTADEDEDEDSGRLKRFNSSNGQRSAAVDVPTRSKHWDGRRNEPEPSDSSSSSFKSTHSTSDDSRGPEALERLEIFIAGNSPTRLDNEVLLALNNVEIDQNSYPRITEWKSKILSHSSSQRQSWPSVTRDAVTWSSTPLRFKPCWLPASLRLTGPRLCGPERYVFRTPDKSQGRLSTLTRASSI